MTDHLRFRAAANTAMANDAPMFQMAPKPLGNGITYRSDDGGRSWLPIVEITDYLRFRSGFAAALDPDFYPITYLDELVACRRGLLWTSANAAIIAEIKTYPGGAKVIHGLVAAGDLEEITNILIPGAEVWAREQGCEFAIIESREGWARQLRGSGYEPYQTSLRKKI